MSEPNAQNKDEIYVVYKKKPDIVQGGKPTVKPAGSVKPPVAPRINKESTPNGDDTNTLALSLISDTAAPAGYNLLSEPIEITVEKAGVRYNQSDSGRSMSNQGVIHQNETDPYTLTVTNNAGYELPSTGGAGTRLFTILGSILTLGTGGLLWRRRRLI